MHEVYMKRAIEVAERGRTSTAPNPWVGCVIVRDDEVIAEGWHKRKGGPHAEIEAIRSLPSESSAAGATAYVTLEPCSHFGATPPCCDALIRLGVARVVVGIGSDPDTLVAGSGTRRLIDAGIEVITGVCEEAVRESLRPYIHHRETARPWVVAKIGSSLNGLLAYPDGTSQWVTAPPSRVAGQRIRAESQAILIGVSTALADDPQLTDRSGAERGILPLTRVVIDPTGRIITRPSLRLLTDGAAPTLIFSAAPAPLGLAPHVEWSHGEVSIDRVLSDLGGRGILQLMVEGGSVTLSRFLSQRRVNELIMFVAPTLIGSGGLPFYSLPTPATVSDRDESLRLVSAGRVEGTDDVRLEYRLS